MKRTLKVSTFASRRASSLSSVISSLTPTRISPVSSSMTSSALDLADDLGLVDREPVEARLAQLADGGSGELAVLADDGLAVDLDVAGSALPGEKVVLDGLRELLRAFDVDRLGVVVEVEQVLGAVAEGLEQHRRVHLPSPVDADVDEVLGVELEVEPRAAVGDDARLVEELARRVGLALVVVEEDARASGGAGSRPRARCR